MRDFKKLEIWHIAMEIVELTYNLVQRLPSTEKYELRSQMNRAAVSIPSNIAEGCGRGGNKELAHFIAISIGSAFELETQVLIGERVRYFNREETSTIKDKLTRFQKASSTYRRRLL